MQKMHATVVASDEPASFLMETLPSLAKIATTFPAQLAEDTVSFLIGNLSMSILVRECRAYSGAACSEVHEVAGRGAVGGVAVTHPQLHAMIHSTFASLAERATNPSPSNPA